MDRIVSLVIMWLYDREVKRAAKEKKPMPHRDDVNGFISQAEVRSLLPIFKSDANIIDILADADEADQKPDNQAMILVSGADITRTDRYFAGWS